MAAPSEVWSRGRKVMDSSIARVDQQRADRSAAPKHSVLQCAAVRRFVFQVASLVVQRFMIMSCGDRAHNDNALQ
ncbi:unnamed protein product [Ectocarpus sp. CCAP 1310/34]|nr:unnamed protein product [Ectocarpus sp. CCAP 1310/34]